MQYVIFSETFAHFHLSVKHFVRKRLLVLTVFIHGSSFLKYSLPIAQNVEFTHYVMQKSPKFSVDVSEADDYCKFHLYFIVQ